MFICFSQKYITQFQEKLRNHEQFSSMLLLKQKPGDMKDKNNFVHVLVNL